MTTEHQPDLGNPDTQPKPRYWLRRSIAVLAGVAVAVMGYGSVNAITRGTLVTERTFRMPALPTGDDITAGHTPYTVLEEVICDNAEKLVNGASPEQIPEGINRGELITQCSRLALGRTDLSSGLAVLSVMEYPFTGYELRIEQAEPER